MAGVESKSKRYRYCFVPHCKSSTFNTPNKRYIPVPRIEGTRARWFKAAHRGVVGSRLSQFYCCEDHFDLENDIANMVQHKLTGCPLKLKDGVLPSIFDCQNNRKCLHFTKHKYSCTKNGDEDTQHEAGNKKNLKFCAVPNCTNSIARTPSKSFIEVPVEDAVRRKWRVAMRQGNFKDAPLPLKSLNYVCEDHFDLENDMENFGQFKQEKKEINLKKDVLPHKFECQQQKSSLRKERAWKRERKRIVADLLRAASVESKESNAVSKPEIISVSSVSSLPDVDEPDKITVKSEANSTLETKADALEKVVVKEEPKSDSELSASEESELNYVLDMVMQENREHHKKRSRSRLTLEAKHQKEENSCSHSSETNLNPAVPEFSLEFLNEGNEETILPDVPAVSGCEDMNSNESSTMSNEAQSFPFLYQKPARISNWEGDHAFKIKVSCETSSKNSLSIYSDILNKLFISKDIGFRILLYAKNVPSGCILRASAMFSHPLRENEVVTRCPTHAHEDRSKGLKHYFHVVQSVSSQASYEMDLATGQFSVVVPYEEPQQGELYTVYGYKLTCFNSCISGINRRPFVILYTLEKNGVELGRYAVDVKVCACPIRDMRLELLRCQCSSDSNSEGENSEEPKMYSLTVDDADLFKFLNQMKVLYESSDFVKFVTNNG